VVFLFFPWIAAEVHVSGEERSTVNSGYHYLVPLGARYSYPIAWFSVAGSVLSTCLAFASKQKYVVDFTMGEKKKARLGKKRSITLRPIRVCFSVKRKWLVLLAGMLLLLGVLVSFLYTLCMAVIETLPVVQSLNVVWAEFGVFVELLLGFLILLLAFEVDRGQAVGFLRNLTWGIGVLGIVIGIAGVAIWLYVALPRSFGIVVLLDGGAYLAFGVPALVLGLVFGFFGARFRGSSLVREVKLFVGGSTFRYVLRRLLYMIPVALGISILSFMTMYASGMDPITIATIGRPTMDETTREALRQYYGLDKPIPIQYATWLGNLLTLNFGKSLRGGIPVNLIIGNWFWETIKLQVISILLAFVISIPIAIYSARRQYSKTDLLVTSTSLFGVSMPTFWLGVILILAFSFYTQLLPPGGAYGENIIWLRNPTLDAIAHLILPTAVLVYVGLAQNIRLLRANMLEVLRSDYILAARASGISESKIIYKYALRNAISPVITFLGIALGAMIAGAPMTEHVFNWPGLGRRFVEATQNMDFPVVMGITMIITAMSLIANLIVDLAYVYLDPRIRLK
jgi:ABC-type dipeptide/oligopeptide/nickel transport system permease component